MKVSAPVAGGELPVVLLSHDFGSSMEGYGPLADFWAAHGFVVRETTDESPARVALIQRATWAYLRDALGIESASWSAVRKGLSATSRALGTIESKQEPPRSDPAEPAPPAAGRHPGC